MYFVDYHTHSDFSSDSTTPIEENIKQAIALSLNEIAITDHIDFDYPDPDFPFLFEYEPYKKQIDFLREKYSDKIKIVLGVEIGLQPHVYEEIGTFISKNHFDFIIGSTHCVDKLDLYTSDFFNGKTKQDAFFRYFEDVLSNIKNFPNFNVYGHVDFINRYGNYPDKTMVYSDFKDITDEILKELISRGKGIELNTSGFRYGLGHTHPQLDLLKRYKELGGEIITIGSDAHTAKDICYHFDVAYSMLKEAKFEYLAIFDNQKPKFIKID